MKIPLLFAVSLTLITTFTTHSQNVNIPDPVFKNFLVNHSYYNPLNYYIQTYLDANNDGEIQYSEAESYMATYEFSSFNGFNLTGLDISDLTGIEAFKGIKWLTTTDLPITSLDVSGCTSLKSLSCYNNLFTSSADIVFPPSLESLGLSGPNLTYVNLTELNSTLKSVAIINTNLISVDMGNVTYNLLTHFTARENNVLTSLDLSKCPNLEWVDCRSNPQLTFLNLANGVPQNLNVIMTNGNPNLTCIQVDNVAVSEFVWPTGLDPNGPAYYLFDSWTSFSVDCSPCFVSIPDANFKAQLVGNSAINTNGNDEIECDEAAAYTGAINVDNANISDLTGIEAFVNITALSCNDNNISSLNLSGFSSLTEVSCTGNASFGTLNVSNCTALTSFNVNRTASGTLSVNANGCTSLIDFSASTSTNISSNLSLDLSGCTSLTELDLTNKKLNFLDVSNCSSLTELKCSNNNLTALNLEGCTALTKLNCSKNKITSLSAQSSPLLTDLNCSENKLTFLNTVFNTNLTTFNCSKNELSYLVVSTNPLLTNLNCSDNDITYLDTANNSSLTILDCSKNLLSNLNVNSNVALTHLRCNSNNLTTINVSNNTNLQQLVCASNNLSVIDVSNNTALKELNCSSNPLSSGLDLSNNTDLNQLVCNNNNLTELDVSANSLLIYLDCSYNQISSLDVSNNQYLLMLLCHVNVLLESLNLANGNNANMFSIMAYVNPLLHCVQVDNAQHSTDNWTNGASADFLFDPQINFSEGDCDEDVVIWTGTEWINGLPDQTKQVAIQGSLSVGTDYGSFSAKTLKVEESGSIVIESGHYVKVSLGIRNNAEPTDFVVESDANLIQTATIGGLAYNTGAITVKRETTIKHLDYTIWSSPVSAQPLKQFSPQTLWYRIYDYNATTDNWQQIFTTSDQSDTNFKMGAGYMFRAPNNFITTPYSHTGVFTGTPNNSSSWIQYNFNSLGIFQGVGNPYPSNISIEKFKEVNTAVGALYFWTNTNAWDSTLNGGNGDYVGNNWAVYSDMVGLPAANDADNKISNGIITVGQGFVIETDGIMNKALFTNDMRVSDNGVFFKSMEENKHRLWLSLSDHTTTFNQTVAGYMNGATQGFDFGIDAKLFGYSGSALYSLIDNDENNYAIQGRALPFDNNDVVSLGFRAINGGNFTISLTDFDGVFAEGQDIYLRDNFTQTEQNLKDGNYIFVSEQGIFNNRFEVVYKSSGGLSTTVPNPDNNWVVYQQNSVFHIHSIGFEMKAVEVYDVLGRQVYTAQAEGTNHTLPNLGANQVLIVKVTTTEGTVLSKKVSN